MERYLHIFKKTALFEDFTSKEILSMLNCLDAKIVNCKKNMPLILAGNDIKQIGIILSGRLRIQKEDVHGNIIVIDELTDGETFGEAFVCAGISQIPITVWAVAASEIAFVDYAKIIRTCHSACSFHTKLIQNMLKTIAEKLIIMNQKMSIIQKNTIREKLMAYFEICIEKNGLRQFTVPFNRSALAEYIGVNRSAMSRELSKMQSDGIIEFSGSKFHIL